MALNTRDVCAILHFPLDAFFPVNCFFDDRAFTTPVSSSVTGVSRYYRNPRMTRNDGRYSLTSQSHLSRESWMRWKGEVRSARSLEFSNVSSEGKASLKQSSTREIKAATCEEERGFCGSIAGNGITTSGECRYGFRRSA